MENSESVTAELGIEVVKNIKEKMGDDTFRMFKKLGVIKWEKSSISIKHSQLNLKNTWEKKNMKKVRKKSHMEDVAGRQYSV